MQICSGSPADRAGLQQVDVIEKVDGLALNNGPGTLGGMLQVDNPGHRLTPTVLRGSSTTRHLLMPVDRPEQPSC